MLCLHMKHVCFLYLLSHRQKFRKNKKMECWESEWKEEYNPGKSLWKGRSVEDDAEFRIKSETRERRDPLKVKCTTKYCSIVSVNVMECMTVSSCYYMSGYVRTLR